MTGYRIYRGTRTGNETLLASVGTGTTYTDTSATNGTTYYYRVSATNGLGESLPSNERSAAPATTPGAPTLNTATGGNNNVALTWTAPASNGGATLTGYRIYRGTAAGNETLLTSVGTGTTYTDTTAVNGTTYYYQVSAMNSVGESARSLERSALPATTAGAPTLTSATAGDGKIDLAWTAPSNGGSPITGYRIYRGTTSGSETLLTNAGGSTTTYTDTSATNGTTYYYEVSAVNAVGEGLPSNERSATPVASSAVPTAPTLMSATPGNSVTLVWSAPASTGGSPITGYNIYRGTTSGGENLLLAVGNVTTYTDETTTDGTTYYYQVSAVNASGESARSIERSATPHASDTTPPSTPSGLKVLLTGTTQIALGWNPSTDNTGVTAYQIFRNGSLVGTVGLSRYLASGLAPGASYTFQVRALDAAGNQSPASTSLSARAATVGRGSTGTVSGVAYTQAGAQLSSGTVTLTSAGGAVKPAKWSKGVWTVSSLAAGTYTVTISVTGYQTQTSVTTVLGGQKSLVLTTL